jgi:hypothetical protein
MYIFLRLVLAHYIGDFILQFNRVYALKRTGLLGGTVHAGLVSLSFIGLSWPFLNLPQMWLIITAFGIIHLFQDQLKLTIDNPKYAFWYYCLDQLFHLVVIATVLLTPLKDLKPVLDRGGLFFSLYNNDLVICYLIAVLFVTYNGFYMIRCFRDTLFGRVVDSRPVFEKKYGMLERLAIVSVFFLGGYYFYVLIILVILRPLVYAIAGKNLRLDKNFISLSEISMSWLLSILAGIPLYILAHRF